MGTTILTYSSLTHRLTYLLSKTISSTNGTHSSYNHFKTEISDLYYAWKQWWTPIKTCFLPVTVKQWRFPRHINLHLLHFFWSYHTKKKSVALWKSWMHSQETIAFVSAAAHRVVPQWQQKVSPWENEGEKMGGTCLHCLPACTLRPLCLWPAFPQLLSLSSLVPV